MTEQTTPFASNQTEAASALGITEEEWAELRKQPGFPERTAQGWNLDAINAWIEADPAPQTPAEPSAGGDPSHVDPPDGAAEATAADSTHDAGQAPRFADHDQPLRFADLTPDPGFAPSPPPDLPDDEPVEIRQVTITLPLAVPRAGTYIAGSRGRINTRLRAEQLPAYRQLHAGLRESNAEYRNGRPVDSAGDVLQWLFEQITAAITQPA